MAIDFSKTFGQRNTKGNVASGQGAGDKAPAQFWLNIGYDSGVEEEDGSGTRFVSLPLGIPLDTQAPVPTNSRNPTFAEFQAARNDLLSEIMKVAQSMAPGESQILNLQIQLRRVNDEVETVAPENNRFHRALKLVG